MGNVSLPSYLHRLLRPRNLAIFEACMIGLVSGLAAVFLKQGVGWLGSWRIYLTQEYPVWFVLPGVGLLGGVLAGWLVDRVAPGTSGSGIPQVKAALASVPMPLDLRVAIVKLAGTVLALGSGLSLGRQGPTVHVGAALAAQLSRWVPASAEYRRQLIAAGAAAGLAAGFNAPIAGVLFVVEELLQDVSNLTLGTAIIASFIGAVISRLLGGDSLNLDLGSSLYQTSFSLQEIPLFVVLGSLAGLLGALFSRGILVSLSLNRRLLPIGLVWRIGLAGLLSGMVLAALPEFLRDNAALREFLIAGESDLKTTSVAFVAKFGLTLLAYGSGAPGGIFAPALLLGSALGDLLSDLVNWLPTLGLPSLTLGSSTTYALAGMGAFFSAVTRGPITAIVIVFEMTTDFNLVLPLMIASVVAYLVAERFSSISIYHHLLQWQGIDLEGDSSKQGLWTDLKAMDIMQRRVETLSSQMLLEEVTQAFSRSHHRGFPVLDGGRLVGIVTQTDLATLKQRSLTPEATLGDIMTPQPVTVGPQARLHEVLYLLDHYKLSRLPVTEQQKLVGIITRSDIIRAESNQLAGGTPDLGPQAEPSYGVYQTRSPAVGRGRLLVPLANPETAESLVQLAAAIAQEHDYELECLQVIVVSRNQSPAETPVRTTASRRLLRRAEQIGREWQVPVHTQIRVAHDLAQAILETVKQRHIDLLIMGWKGATATPGRVFGGAVDTLIRQAPCELVLVKLGSQATQRPHPFERWLVPIAGGPNAQEAIKLLPGLVALSQFPDVGVCQVFDPATVRPDTSTLKADTQFLHRRLNCPVQAISLFATAVPEIILRLARRDRRDVIVLGASRESLLQQVIKGNIPEAIARDSDCTVILVRGPSS
jgi:chloride channel protein, CIC family